MGLLRVLTIVIGMSSAASVPLNAESLNDALTAAYGHSGLLDQNRALLRAADEDVALAVAATLPVVNWAANASSQEPRAQGADLIAATASLTANWTLYDSGAGQFAVEAQKELVLGTRQSLINVEQQVLLSAVQAYMNVQRDDAFLGLRKNNVNLISQQLRAARDRFEVGEVTRTDVSLAEARLAGAKSQVAAAEGQLARSIAEFKVATGRNPIALETVEPAPVSKTLDAAKSFATRNHPAMKEAQHAVSAAELSILRGQALSRPKVSVSGEVGIDQDGNIGRRIGLTASGPIYSGGSISAQIRQLMSRRDASRAALHLTRHSIEQQVANAFSFYDVAAAMTDAAERQIRAATVAFRGVKEEATLGTRTTLDVLNAEQELLNARADAISAQVDRVVASYSLLSSMGLLTVDHLRLPVKKYDPTAYYNMVKDAPTSMSEQGKALDRILRAIDN